MNQSPRQDNTISDIRELAREFTTKQIIHCENQQLDQQSNTCIVTGEPIQVLNTLAKVGVVRRLIDEGASLNEAIRELGRRIRSLGKT